MSGWKCILKEVRFWELPWWSSGGESASQCRGRGFDTRSGKTPRAGEEPLVHRDS